MNKELLNKILPYCGHGLKVAHENSIVSTELSNFMQMCEPSEDGQYFKPVLFPPYCLTRQIETEHGKEVPLIEMAKMSWGDRNWIVSAENTVEGDGSIWFGFCKGAFLVESSPKGDVLGQWELFQYLYSRHIAFNLEPGEYVSVESLEKNPYKDEKI